jgi:hypothetical protein
MNKVVFIVSLLFTIETISIYAKPARILTLTKKDKAQIIKSILRKESVKKEFAKADTVYLLQNEILTPDFVPEGFKGKIILITQEEVDSKKKTEPQITYFSFRTFKVRASKVEVKFGYSHSSKTYYNAETTTYEYRKRLGKWKGIATRGSMTIGE